MKRKRTNTLVHCHIHRGEPQFALSPIRSDRRYSVVRLDNGRMGLIEQNGHQAKHDMKRASSFADRDKYQVNEKKVAREDKKLPNMNAAQNGRCIIQKRIARNSKKLQATHLDSLVKTPRSTAGRNRSLFIRDRVLTGLSIYTIVYKGDAFKTYFNECI